MYYLITGVKLQKSYERVAQDNTIPLSRFNIEIKDYQERALLKGINVQIEDRYSSMAELYYDLYQEQLPGEELNPKMMQYQEPPEIPNISREEAAIEYLRQQKEHQE